MSSLELNLFDIVPAPDSEESFRGIKDHLDHLPDKKSEYEGSARLAIDNFVGVMVFHTEGQHKALEVFLSVLEQDEDNLNALQNCLRVYKRLQDDLNADRYENQLNKLLDKTNPRKPLLQARLHAELGFAMSYEFPFSSESIVYDYERLHKATLYFEKALETPSLLGVDDQSEWNLLAARCYSRLYDRLLKRQPKSEEMWDQAIIGCIKACKSVLDGESSVKYKAKAWEFLGRMFFKMTLLHKELHKTVFAEHDLTRELKEPSLCYERALNLCPDNAELWCRYARFFKFQNKFEKALDLLDRSIGMDNSRKNWFAFSSRGVVGKQYYYWMRKNHDKPPTWKLQNILRKAQFDLEKSLQLKLSPEENIELAEVNQLLAKENPSERQQYYEQVMEHFNEAQSLLGNKKHPYLYLNLGDFLKSQRKFKDAADAYKKALDNAGTARSLHNINDKLEKLLLKDPRIKRSPRTLLKEIEELENKDYASGEVSFSALRKALNAPPRQRQDTGNGQATSDGSGSPLGAARDNSQSSRCNDNDNGEGDDVALRDQLEKYFTEYVDIPPASMHAANRVVYEVAQMLQIQLERHLPWCIGTLKQVGSTAEGLKVIQPDEFDFMIPLTINPSDWSLIKASETDHKAPGFWLLKKKTSQSTPFDTCIPDLADGYVSPAKLRSLFQGALHKVTNCHERSTGYTIKSPSVHGPSVTLTVEYGQRGKSTLSIDFVPTVSYQINALETVDIVAKPHPSAILQHERDNGPNYDILWRGSFSTIEGRALSKATADQLKCLKVLKAVRANSAQLGKLSSYVLKTIFLHELQPDKIAEWSHQTLDRQFVYFITTLARHAKERYLQHYFSPDVNLFDLHEPMSQYNLQTFLERQLREKTLVSLLEWKRGNSVDNTGSLAVD